MNKEIYANANDRVSICEYAKQLEGEGNYRDALMYYTKASNLGSIEAARRLKELERKHQEKVSQESQKEQEKEKSSTVWNLKNILVGVLILLFAISIVMATDIFFNPYNTDSRIGNDLGNASKQTEQESVSSTLGTEKTIYKKDELLFLIVASALEHYKEERGEYPASLNELIHVNPENWLSFIPKGMQYKIEEQGYSLTYKEINKEFANNRLFELNFYPEKNLLALISGKEIVATIPVASGKVALPFTDSKVLERVVEPNGKGSSFGTRGLVLENDIAIHGTNNPNSIGQYATEGSIRMFNQDIEGLYSYISKGTPFHIVIGTPEKPMFSMGLPILHDGNIPFENETNENKIYKWKN